jgi:hypothetical protein
MAYYVLSLFGSIDTKGALSNHKTVNPDTLTPLVFIELDRSTPSLVELSSSHLACTRNGTLDHELFEDSLLAARNKKELESDQSRSRKESSLLLFIGLLDDAPS